MNKREMEDKAQRREGWGVKRTAGEISQAVWL